MAEFAAGLGALDDGDGLGWTGDPEVQGAPEEEPTHVEDKPMPQGNAGTLAQTVPALRDAVLRARRDPRVRATALKIISVVGNDKESRIVALYNWVRDSVRYVNDPTDTEFVTTPAKLLDLINTGEAWEDCESMVALLSSLLESIGIHTRFVLTQNAPDPESQEYTHIFLEAQGSGGRWMVLDPTPPYREAGEPMFRQRGRRVVEINGLMAGSSTLGKCVAIGALVIIVGYAAWTLGSSGGPSS